LHPARKPNPVHRCTPLANSKEDTVPTGAPARSDQNGAGAPLTEFVTWPHLQAETGTRSWFCDAQSPHRKGAVENTNRRVRRYLPRKIDMRQLTDADIRAVTDRMNATPRKCLGWRTPAEVFAEKMVEIAGSNAYSRATRKSQFL
ncbi:MAG: hypothetical protein WBF53_02245, partial [Litorimonas sp.]